MNWKLYLKISFGVVAISALPKILAITLVEPWVERKIEASFNEHSQSFGADIGKVNLLLWSSGLELERIAIFSKPIQGRSREEKGRIATVTLSGISIVKAIIMKEICVNGVTISGITFKGTISCPKENPPIVSPLTIRVGTLILSRINIAIGNNLNEQTYSVKDGLLKVYSLHVRKQDTLSLRLVKQFDFEAKELLSISADSMYSYRIKRIDYSDNLKRLTLSNFSIQPNYADYDFTSRHHYQTDRIEVGFSNISVSNFSIADYISKNDLISSYVEIGKMDLVAFRDKRKEFRHAKVSAFQDLIYSYPGAIAIDSIGVLSGSITYKEHAPQAHKPGRINFSKVYAKAYRITNDTIYKRATAFLELYASALLMGKGHLVIHLNGRLFDPLNAFSVNGSLSGMYAKELNPMVAQNAFVYATSGKIDAMSFNFSANNSKSTGKLAILYHGLAFAFKNKRTDDTTALKEKLISSIANIYVLDANPVSGEKVRVGIIDYRRDSEKFLFNYCFKSILSGIKTSLVKNPKKGNKSQ